MGIPKHNIENIQRLATRMLDDFDTKDLYNMAKDWFVGEFTEDLVFFEEQWKIVFGEEDDEPYDPYYALLASSSIVLDE